MSNTYSTAAQNLADVASSSISTLLAPLAKIATAFPLEQGKAPAIPRVINVVNSVSDTQTAENPDYTIGDAVSTPTAISHTLFTQPFGIGNDELNEGAKLAWLYQLNSQKIAASISDAVFSLVNTTNFGSPVAIANAASFIVTDFESLFNAVPTANRAVVLNTPYFSKIKSTWTPPGFSNVLEHTRWSSAGANVQGFASDPAAIVLSYAMPTLASPHRNVVAEAPFNIAQIGLQGAATIYYLMDTRRLMGCLSIYMGASVGDSNALKLLASA